MLREIGTGTSPIEGSAGIALCTVHLYKFSWIEGARVGSVRRKEGDSCGAFKEEKEETVME